MSEDLEEDKNIMLIYEWVDSSNLSRPKKNISRDFSDGVLLAELLKNINPNLVELHNYPSSNSTNQKIQNWNTLNRKVLKKLGITISDTEINQIVNCKPFVIEQVLAKIYNKIYQNDNLEQEVKIKSNISNKEYTKDEIIKNAIDEKDKIINELNSTLEILQMKLRNSEDENKRLEEKIQQYQIKLMNKK